MIRDNNAAKLAAHLLVVCLGCLAGCHDLLLLFLQTSITAENWVTKSAGALEPLVGANAD
jgi:hypothetical protein